MDIEARLRGNEHSAGEINSAKDKTMAKAKKKVVKKKSAKKKK